MKTTMGILNSSHNLKNPPLHIPDDHGGTYKTELVLFSSQKHTEKINWWHGNDRRDTPHNHPWDFTSTILHGGYTEDRWSLVDGKYVKTTTKYVQGDKNTILTGEFHVVYDVLDGTVSHMVCGEMLPESEWGYLDLDTFEYVKADKDPDFFDKLCKLNPFKG